MAFRQVILCGVGRRAKGRHLWGVARQIKRRGLWGCGIGAGRIGPRRTLIRQGKVGVYGVPYW